jgi:transaldolase
MPSHQRQPNPLIRLADLGQSPWLDLTTRDLIRSRELHRLVAEDGVRGLTTNPTIFEKSIASGSIYDADIIALTEAGFGPDEVLERLMVAEVQEACDVFEPMFRETMGQHGYVSLEVSPLHAYDAESTVRHARHLWEVVGRRNLMVKIPGTREGLAAIERCLTLGIHVNVTLLFSVPRYREVSDAYLAALGARRVAGLPLDQLSSVASFFVSRVDTLVDAKLDAIGTPPARKLRGKAAVANAALAYEAYRAVLTGPVWASYAAHGARSQRPLWASTSMKDPGRPPLGYCEALIAPATVNTLPPATLAAYRASGEPEVRLDERAIADAHRTVTRLEELGISLADVAEELEQDGVRKFVASWKSLRTVLERKAAVLATRA